MNILILQGSPRANGNTAWMAEEYRKAAESAGHKVTLVDVAHKKIAGCMACEYCHGKGNGACVQKDDMQELYPLLAEAEVLVLAAPIYYFTLSAQIQAPIQRIYCMNKPGKLKKMALLASSYSPNVYDGAIGEYRGILNYWASRTRASSRPKTTSRRRTRRGPKFSSSLKNYDYVFRARFLSSSERWHSYES